jgi:hypothetical protein
VCVRKSRIPLSKIGHSLQSSLEGRTKDRIEIAGAADRLDWSRERQSRPSLLFSVPEFLERQVDLVSVCVGDAE